MRIRLRVAAPSSPEESRPWSWDKETLGGDVELVVEGGLAFLHHPGEPYTKTEAIRVDGVSVEVVEVDPGEERR